MAKRAATTWTFTTTAALVDWMQDEHLSLLTLEALEAATPTTVRFTWRLHGVGNGQTVPYRVEARGVRRFVSAGPPGDAEVSFPASDRDGPGVALVMETPGRLELACDEVVVSRGPRTRARRARRPHTDYAYFLVEGARTLTMPEVLAGLGVPDRAVLAGTPPVTRDDARPVAWPQVGTVDVVVDGAVWIMFYCRPRAAPGGFHITPCRKGCSDDEWHRVQEFPRHVGPARVSAAWEFDGSAAAWLRLIGR